MQKVILAGIVAIFVFLAGAMPIGHPDQSSGERPRVVTEIRDFVGDVFD